MAKKRLGLDALFQSSVPAATPAIGETTEGEFREVAVGQLRPGSRQPRHEFDPSALADLASSVAAHGVLQPILERVVGDEPGFEIVAGERRWRAAQSVGLEKVPVRVVALDDEGALVVAITENLQREDLSPLEEAEGYIELLRGALAQTPDFEPYCVAQNLAAAVVRVLRALNNNAAGNSKDNVVLRLEPVVKAVFTRIGRMTWQSFVAHRLPLLAMPEELRAAIRDRGLPYTKARAIGKLTRERLNTDEATARKLRMSLVDDTIAHQTPVRDLSSEVARLVKNVGVAKRSRPKRDSKSRRTGLAGRFDALVDRGAEANFDDYGPARRAEIAAAIEALLKLL